MPENKELVDGLIEMIERDSGKEVFTMRVLDHTKDGLKSLIVFTDGKILKGEIKVQTTIDNKMALRLQGNYI